ncbi:MAG TPA: hypothetical protein VGB78_08455 [Thermoplasmata archaeon]
MPRVSELIKKLAVTLGFDIEGHLVNYEPHKDLSKTGGVHVKQGKGSVTNIVMLDSRGTRELLKSGNLREAIQMTPSEVGGMTREDLAGYDFLALLAQEDNRELLKRLQSIISHDDFVALSIAATIRKYEIHSQGAKAVELRNRLRQHFKERGNRIYVFFASGMLEEFMGPTLAWIEFSGTISDRMKALELWNACLDHMDYAIYVNRLMTDDEIVHGLRQRFRIDNVPVVLLFGRTVPIIEKIGRAIKEFQTIESEYQVDAFSYGVTRKEYRLGDHDSVVCIVNKFADGGAAIPSQSEDDGEDGAVEE